MIRLPTAGPDALLVEFRSLDEVYGVPPSGALDPVHPTSVTDG
ncbi:MAG: hypothetical protein ACRDRZ_07740 [Pseudonocardiaceae bacterium]